MLRLCLYVVYALLWFVGCRSWSRIVFGFWLFSDGFLYVVVCISFGVVCQLVRVGCCLLFVVVWLSFVVYCSLALRLLFVAMCDVCVVFCVLCVVCLLFVVIDVLFPIHCLSVLLIVVCRFVSCLLRVDCSPYGCCLLFVGCCSTFAVSHC